MATKTTVKVRTGTNVLRQPAHIKKQAVKEIESGEITIQQAMEKYQTYDRRSILDWMRQYSELEESEYMQKQIPIDLRRSVAYQIETGLLTVYQAAKKHLVTRQTVRNWRKRYSCNTNNSIKPQEMPTVNRELIARAQPEEKKEPDLLKLKIAALETMIDIAEKEYNIEIRKKPGTKQ